MTLEHIRHIYYNNLILLAFDVHHPETLFGEMPTLSDTLPPLTRDFFSLGHPKSGAMLEHILYFLFMTYDRELTREKLKGCWPILDRLQGREFRSILLKWMDELKRLPQSHVSSTILHNMTARKSILDDPRGERFEIFLAALTTFILACTKSIESNSSAKEKGLQHAWKTALARNEYLIEESTLAETRVELAIQATELKVHALSEKKKKYTQTLEKLKSCSSSMDFNVALEQRSLEIRSSLVHEQWPMIQSKLGQLYSLYENLTVDYQRWLSLCGSSHDNEIATLDPTLLQSAMNHQMQARLNLSCSDPEPLESNDGPDLRSLVQGYLAVLKGTKAKLDAILYSNRQQELRETALVQKRNDFQISKWLTPYVMTENEIGKFYFFGTDHVALLKELHGAELESETSFGKENQWTPKTELHSNHCDSLTCQVFSNVKQTIPATPFKSSPLHSSESRTPHTLPTPSPFRPRAMIEKMKLRE